MTKEQLWKIYCEKNPQFAKDDGDVTLTVRGLKKLFDQVFEQGEKHGRGSSKSDPVFNNIFGSGFGF